MEINADNLKWLGFVCTTESEDYSQYTFRPGEFDNVYVIFEWGAFPQVYAPCAVPVPHAKTIEHIQQLINLFIDPKPLVEFHL